MRLNPGWVADAGTEPEPDEVLEKVRESGVLPALAAVGVGERTVSFAARFRNLEKRLPPLLAFSTVMVVVTGVGVLSLGSSARVVKLVKGMGEGGP